MTRRERPGFFSPTGIVAAVALVVIVVAVTLVLGPVLFSPGSLNAQAKTAPLGGVASHAKLGNRCGACHTAPCCCFAWPICCPVFWGAMAGKARTSRPWDS